MEQGLAGGLAFVSLALPTGWYWLKKGQSKTQSWQNLEQRWLGRTAEFFYFVGLPYLALLFGLLTPKLLGLKGLEHFALISTSNLSMVSLAVGAQKAITLMLVESLVDSGVMIGAGLIGLIILGGITLGLARYGISVGTFQTSVVDTIYYCLHWAFYRAIFWSMTGDLYLGVVLGGGLVMLEGGVIIWLQQGRPAQLSSPFLMEVIILILTSAIFFYCPNLWLLWPIHLAMVVLIKNKSLLKEAK
jgi:hypothetical protein